MTPNSNHLMCLTMKNIYRIAMTLAACFASFMPTVAQHTESGFFNENYVYRYQMNPAIENRGFFISMPALGNLDMSLNGTLNLKDFIYNVDGKTTTFMNPKISAEEALDGFKDMNRIGTDVKVGVLAVGFKGFGGYNTLTVNARANVQTRLPYEVFSILKEGPTNKTYDIADMGARGTVWAEVGISHSHSLDKFVKGLRIGAGMKVLVGGADVAAHFNKAQLTFSDETWSLTNDAYIEASMKGLTYEHDFNDNTNREYVSGVDVDNTGINGYGVAFDFGAQYKLGKDWEFDLSFVDLGFINWKNNMLATTNGEQTVRTSDFIFSPDDHAANSFEDELDRMADDLSLLYELDDAGDQGKRKTTLGATMYAGAKYSLPVYRKLSFGVLNTTRIQGEYSWTDFRFSANIAPCKVLSASINYGVGTFGSTFGWIFNFHPKGFNLFLAQDYTLGKLAKQGVPLTSNASVNLGVNLLF